MSHDVAEQLDVAGTVYSTYAFPLDDYLSSLTPRPRLRPWPGCANGYRATWAVAECGNDRVLYLTGVTATAQAALAPLLAQQDGPVAATWFHGMVRCTRGEQRRTGYPPRTFCDDDMYLEVVAGRVVREWVRDLRAVPDQTDDELRLSLPRFLWGPRLLDGAAPSDRPLGGL